MSFAPIAIVGQGCVLPGALDPQSLWDAVAAGRSLLSRAEEGSWGRPTAQFLHAGTDGAPPPDKAWHDVGGYVRGFEERFDPAGFDLPAERIQALAPLFQWVLHAGREAFRMARFDGDPARVGSILGNLSYPTRAFDDFCMHQWLPGLSGLPGTGDGPHPLNRFMSGYPAQLLTRALGASGRSYCLDAACASSLYAIKFACDALQRGEADLMLAGGVNAINDLFLHVGFTSLLALSRSGRSRPFHRAADGLVPAVGAAIVALRRLEDAEAAGDRILGVIRGIGLSNDGSKGGFLSPSESAQTRAMELAYRGAGLAPRDVSLIECHATGTVVGDSVEIASLSRVFADCAGVPIGSLKSNLGHLTTAAGAAGLLKVLAAFAAGLRPPTLGADDPLPQIAGSPLRLLTQAEPWDCNGPRRAAISAFGFGGNNAHLIVEEYAPDTATRRRGDAANELSGRVDEPIAIVGIGICAADLVGREAFARAWLQGESRIRERASDGLRAGFASEIELDCLATGFPPSDLAETHPQQLLLLAAAREALQGARLPAPESVGVFIGVGADTEVGRYNLRLQWPTAEAGGMASAAPALTAARTIGCMPNIPANRLNVQADFQGPSLTFSAEELSGIVAFENACAALRAGEADAVLAGAADLSAEPAHAAAARACLPEDRHVPGDAAVVLVLKRLSDARAAGDTIYAVWTETVDDESDLVLGPNGGANLAAQFGHAHAASGLLHVAAGALALHHRALPAVAPGRPRPWLPSGHRFRARIEMDALGGGRASLQLTHAPEAAPAPLPEPEAPRLHLFAGADRQEALRRLRDGAEGADGGPARLAIVASSRDEFARRREQALQLLEGAGASRIALMKGISYADRPLGGEVAFTFPPSAGAYSGMGRELLLAFPDLVDKLLARVRRAPSLREAAGWMYGDSLEDGAIPLFDKLKGALFLSQAHAILSQEVLGIRPDACIGFSAGETAALFAAGAWTEIDDYYGEVAASGIWTRELATEWNVLTTAWADRPDVERRWRNWAVFAPLDEVEAALADEPLVHVVTINAPGNCAIAGQAEACDRVIARLGAGRCQPLHYDLIHHCPEMTAYREAWTRLNTRETAPLPIRFYTGADPGVSFLPTAERAAWALVGMSERTIDFPRMIRQAWDDGVRVFVEHGARSACTSYIQQILGDRPHLAVSFDSFGAPDARQVCETVAQLWAAGVALDASALLERLAKPEPAPSAARTMRKRFPAHMPPVRVPASPADERQSMPPAPPLPSALALYLDPRNRIEPEPAPVLPPPPVSAAVSAPVAAPVAAPQGAPALAQASAYIESLSRLHQDFVRQQAETHAAFMRVRDNALQALLYASRAMGPLPAPALPPIVAPIVTPAPVAIAPPPAPPAPRIVEAPTADGPRAPVGPTFDRAQLKVHASGRISEIFGPLFAQQDGYAVQVRMPEPPLLLADRVTGIDAEPGSLKLGTVWTETDIRPDSWFVHQGRILPAMMIESGQADLFLISYLGIDFKNRGERAYRLLGCEATYLAPLPQPGQTLCFDIHIDAHAIEGQKHLFFFHYDCHVDGRPVLRVRNGQAGFFTKEELAESKGVLWSAETAQPDEAARLDAPRVECRHARFDRRQLEAFAAGRITECFGPEYAWTETHTRTPAIAGGRMLLLDEVTQYDPRGGPWGRGYLRAVRRISPDDWFFGGHFKNDPCMPGTLMTEMAFQGMSVYLTALGYSLDKDGWTFAPVPGERCKLSCRGQVTPASRELVLEIFVREVVDGPVPTLIADILSTVDGLKALHAERLSLHLTPDFPNSSRRLLPPASSNRPTAMIGEIPCDEKQASDCALGRPSETFGEAFAAFDAGRRTARLPGEPYLFISRIADIDANYLGMEKGGRIVAEWDIPSDHVFFDENGARTLPYCVIQEAALQPCGWLSVYMGCPLAGDRELAFRNLDGTLELFTECLEDAGTLRTVVENTSISRMPGTIILSFKVESWLGDRLALRMTTVFGYFETEALARQLGLPTTDDERAMLTAPSEFALDFADRPGPYCRGSLRLAERQLLMFDRISGYWPRGGEAGLGRVRGEKRVRPEEWFFKAHFFQDPVQPGSLGLEVMLQLLQFYMLREGMGDGMAAPRFEPLALGMPITWRYRGQVTPANRIIQTVLDVTETGRDERGAYAKAKASLWCDGLKIYEATEIGMRIVPGEAPRFDRAALEQHATGLVGPLFGESFAPLDGLPLRTRLPAPPFLLLDRVTGLDARPGSLGRGAVRTELDLGGDSWFLQDGRMPASLALEAAGQSGIFLCSWLGADLAEPLGTRVFRILGLQGFAFHGALPQRGDRLRYEVVADDVRRHGAGLFFTLSYRCRIGGRVCMTTQRATVGYLTQEELRAARGVTWAAATARPPALPHAAPAASAPGPDSAHLTHLPEGRLRLINAVTEFHPAGGPWERGYLRAVKEVRPEDWFFQAHFLNDPCIPAALLGEGCVQSLTLYCAALGLRPAGEPIRLLPIPDERFDYQGGGQVTPSAREIAYEVFVESLQLGPTPTIRAHVLVTVDGVHPVLHTRLGMTLA